MLIPRGGKTRSRDTYNLLTFQDQKVDDDGSANLRCAKCKWRVESLETAMMNPLPTQNPVGNPAVDIFHTHALVVYTQTHSPGYWFPPTCTHMHNSKLQAQFQSMEVRNSCFAAFIDIFTPNTYVMVILSDSSIRKLQLSA